jgi:hypothetical protein
MAWEGAAPDTALTEFDSVLGRRLHIAAGQRCSCSGSAIDLVAVDPLEPALPSAARSALRELAPGRAIAGSALTELVGGWIAMAGVNISVVAAADLGGSVIAISFDDAVAMLKADVGQRLLVRTTVVVQHTSQAAPLGWQLVLADVSEVPLSPWDVTRLGHRQGCAA